jgi:hypothetical protein
MVNAPLILRFGPASVQNGNLEVKKSETRIYHQKNGKR